MCKPLRIFLKKCMKKKIKICKINGDNRKYAFFHVNDFLDRNTCTMPIFSYIFIKGEIHRHISVNETPGDIIFLNSHQREVITQENIPLFQTLEKHSRTKMHKNSLSDL